MEEWQERVINKKLKIKFSAYRSRSLGFRWIDIKTAVLDVPIHPWAYNIVFASNPVLHVGRSWNFVVTILNYCYQISLFYGHEKNLTKECGYGSNR
jgi:hypothetical protein